MKLVLDDGTEVKLTKVLAEEYGDMIEYRFDVEARVDGHGIIGVNVITEDWVVLG